MTVYVYRPLMSLPTPWSNGTGSSSGSTAGSVWGAGVRAGTYPIRIGSLEGVGANVILSLVTSATLHNSAQGPAITPNPMREGTPTCTATTAMGTTYTTYNGSSYNYFLSGAIPSGTFQYLGTTSTIVPFHFEFDVIVNPGSAFWMGSDVTPVSVNNLSTGFIGYQGRGGTVGSFGLTFNQTPTIGTAAGVALYFEELREPWSY